MNTEELEKLFGKVKGEAESFYNGVNQIDCPYLKTKVNFNAKGLDHIKMKAWNKTRPASDQYLRLKFLKLVPDVLSVAGTIQEINETKNFERIKDSGKWQQVMKEVTYYAFIAIVKKIKLRLFLDGIEHICNPATFYLHSQLCTLRIHAGSG